MADTVERWTDEWKGKETEAIADLKKIVTQSPPGDAKVHESALRLLSRVLSSLGDSSSLSDLVTSQRPFLASVPRARAGKIIRAMVDDLARVPGARSSLITLCKGVSEWATETGRDYLRHRVDLRLARALVEDGDASAALAISEPLSRDLRKLDDKTLAISVSLVESLAHHALRDTPRAKASLTTARTSANSVYTRPSVQAELDLQSGVLLAEEGDFKTAYSYFFEAFETNHGLATGVGGGDGDAPASRDLVVRPLKYMMMCKVMLGKSGEVSAVANSKNASSYSGDRGVVAMISVAESCGTRSIHSFEASLDQYDDELRKDPVVDKHLSKLYDDLLVQNLSKLIEPFSKVEISHLASLINLPVPFVEQKLSQMILDKRLNGILDQGEGNLIVFEPRQEDEIYKGAIDTVKGLNDVVDSLFTRASCLT